MKTIILALCTTLVFCASAVAEDPNSTSLPKPVQPQSIPENYVVTLTITDKEQKTTELSLVVASADFKTDFPDAQSNVSSFVGTITPEDEKTVSIRYALGGQIAVSVPPGNIQYRSITTQATVRLKLGETRPDPEVRHAHLHPLHFPAVRSAGQGQIIATPNHALPLTEAGRLK